MVLRVQQNKNSRREAGIAYVMILLLLVTLTSLSLAFLHKTGTQMAATANRGESMQAHYLAESAANHAMWRLLNDPAFAPAADTYYMHSFANGRYGYKVRKPTETTFATVATVGTTGDIVTHQSYVQYVIPSNVFISYGSSTNSLPRYRRLIGAQWTDPGDVLTGGSDPVYWMELEGCPIRKELVAGIIDAVGEMKVAVYDGTTWGNNAPFGHGDRMYKCLDIAYESQSGHALVVGRDGTDTPLYYNIWDGTSWAFVNPQFAFSLPGGNVHDVVMASQPGGNEILIAVVTSWDDIQLVRWDGSAFHDLGTIEGTTANNDFRIVEIIYEHKSGDAMVVWSRNGDSALKFRMWNGAALGPEGSLPDFGGNENYVIRGAADSNPTSDYIVIAAIDNFYDISVAVWDGDAWIDFREIETSAGTNLAQSFDVAWEAAGEDVVIAWAPWGPTNVRFLTWKKGAALADSTVQDGPDLQIQPWLVRLLPVSESEKIILLGQNNISDLSYCLWTGDQWKGDPGVLLEPNVPVQNDVAFDLAEANVPVSGGTGTGAGGGNLAPVVDAGSDQTIYLPINQVDLDGTVTDDGLPNPPATVTTMWSKVSGPGTVNFDDSSLVDTVARFSEAGTYVLRLTADDSDLSAFDEVTITVIKPCTLLFVVGNPGSLTSADTGRKGLFESWGYIVTLIDDGDTQANFDAAIAANDVVYVGPSASGPSLLDKVTGANTGVVNEINGKLDNFGFSSSTSGTVTAATVSIVDNTHYITSEFTPGLMIVFNTSLAMPVPSGTLAPDLLNLAEAPSSPGQPAVVALETGAQRYDGGMAPERRVHLPYVNANVSDLTSDAQIIMKRAIDWAAHKEGGCGGGGSLLYVVDDASNLSPEETARKGMMEVWGWTVTLIGDDDTQANFDSAATVNDAAYISQEAVATTLGSKLNNTPIGVVNESKDMIDDFGFATGVSMGGGLPTLNVDMTHYITSVFTASPVAPYVANDWYQITNEPVATGVDPVGTWVEAPWTGKPALMTLSMGDTLIGGGSAAGRRVQIPWGSGQGTTPVALSSLSDDAKTIMRRAIEWAASGGGGGGGSDPDPPTPDPMTWASPPTADGPFSIRMTATTASDPSGVAYYFECTAGGGSNSGWQDSSTYADTGLSSETQYTYRVKARDKSASQNETGWSSEASATTPSTDIYVYDITMGFGTAPGNKYFGRATVWIKSASGENISGAVVSGDWSGAVSDTSIGTTGSDGKVTLESSNKKNGGTFTFTVTNVTKLGYTYNPSLNVETSDTITAP